MFLFRRRQYTTLQKIEMAKYPVIMAPVWGRMIPVMVRELTAVQIRSCGNISLIQSFEDKARAARGRFSRREIVAFSERHREILRHCMVQPTYDEFFNTITSREKKEDIEKQFKELEALLAQCPRGPKRQQLEEERDSLRVWFDLVLPDDFVATIVSYALGVNKSDIQSVTEEMLLEAAYLAKRGNDNPCDHLQGEFTDFMREDINMRAWYILDQKQEEMRINAS